MDSHRALYPDVCEAMAKADGAPTIVAGRYYGCTFCKRGFTNAQALGGHMNIHRRDRARDRHTPPSCAVPDYLLATDYLRAMMPLFPLFSERPREPRGRREEDAGRMRELRRYGKDLGLGFTVSGEEAGGGGGDGEEEVDGLELRLGL